MSDPSIDQALRNDSGRVIYALRSRNSYAISNMIRAAEKMGIIDNSVAIKTGPNPKQKIVNEKNRPEEEIITKASVNKEISAVDEIKAKINQAIEMRDPKTGKRILSTSKTSYNVKADDIMGDIDADLARQKIMSLYENKKL